ncbi:hypothetical protein PN416_07555 [Halorubrum ezzemoulense]|uniref:hypothetical protein n=1 Tax=Halorubrum ezzemoulense TaxID=337243 RepID=UPI00233026A9|nr:hypothetical protein [Halorubrum ezzemoulense]MDB9279749.1 hypothetical protein [Halorubrum ezzemoulense]MDB9283296.1 hypothetical protein [Halorubrum ezzemoulense]
MSDSSERTRTEAVAPGDPAVDAAAENRSRLARTWYRSRFGVGVIAADVLLTVGLAAGALLVTDGPFPGFAGLGSGVVPLFVPLFSLLGALGFVFTALVERFDASVGTLVRYNLRLPAALPLGVGVYLLSDILLGGTTGDAPLVAGVVFLSGLYVNLAYKRLGALARRLLPASADRSAGSGDRES